MNVNDIVTIATDAIPTDNLNSVELAHISGIIAMAVRLAVAEVETELAESEKQKAALAVELITAANSLADMTAARDAALKRVRLVVADCEMKVDEADEQTAVRRRERDEARQELADMTAARDAAVARSEALAGELAALRTNGVNVTGAT